MSEPWEERDSSFSSCMINHAATTRAMDGWMGSRRVALASQPASTEWPVKASSSSSYHHSHRAADRETDESHPSIGMAGSRTDRQSQRKTRRHEADKPASQQASG